MQRRPHQLLQQTRLETDPRRRTRRSLRCGSLVVRVRLARPSRGCRWIRRLVLPDDVAVVLARGTAEELERHDEEDDADARPGHHAAGCDMPLRGEEAWEEGVSGGKQGDRQELLTGVDRVPVPQHLDVVSVGVVAADETKLTEILQDGPSPPMPIPLISMLCDADAIAADAVELIDMCPM